MHEAALLVRGSASYQRVVAAGHADVAPGQEGAGQAVT